METRYVAAKNLDGTETFRLAGNDCTVIAVGRSYMLDHVTVWFAHGTVDDFPNTSMQVPPDFVFAVTYNRV